MNKKLLSGITTFALMGAFFAGESAQAAAGDTSTNMKTESGIGFVEYNPGSGPFENNLALTFVPASFDFGSANKRSTVTTTYAQQGTPSAGQYLGVSDDRETKTSWNVKASLANFVDTSDATNTLENATLSMKLGNVQKYAFDAVAADEAQYATPAPSETTLSALATDIAPLYAGVAAGTVNLTAGGSEVKVMNYDLGSNTAATGTAAVARQITDVTLNVKASNAADNKKFKSTIQWVLADDAA